MSDDRYIAPIIRLLTSGVASSVSPPNGLEMSRPASQFYALTQARGRAGRVGSIKLLCVRKFIVPTTVVGCVWIRHLGWRPKRGRIRPVRLQYS